MTVSWRSLASFGTLVLLVTNPVSAAVLFDENFDGLTLGPNVDETLFDPTAFTHTPPAGWTIDNSGTPAFDESSFTNGVEEWRGWSFADPSFWAAVDQQSRDQFTLGQNVIMVADADEWDDDPHPAGDYNTFISTPPINISAAAAGELFLTFDSSWRAEGTQKANITASYDGGPEVEVLRFESDPASPSFQPDALNERTGFRLDHPAGATNMVLTFGYFDADNNWWWAIDNLLVSTGAPALGIEVDRDSGEITVRNDNAEDVRPIRGYEVRSSALTLNPGSWTSIGDGGDADSGGAIDADDNWVELSGASANNLLSEGSLGQGEFGTNESFSLGVGTWAQYYQEDVTFDYLDENGDLVVGFVSFVGNSGEAFKFGDLDFNGMLNIDDWAKFRGDLAAAPDLAGLVGPELYANSDLNGDGVHSEQDFFEFRKAYDAANGAGAFAALVSVPEPASIALVGLGGLVLVAARRRRRSSEPPVIQQEITKPRGSRCLTKTSLLLAAILVVGIAALEQRASAQLFVDDMGADSAANWTIVASGGDASAEFGHDYSTAGLPPAPNGSDTIGLRTTVNNAAGATARITATHFDNAFTGQFTTQIDIWINWVVDGGATHGLGQGTTEAVAVSVGHDGLVPGPFGATLLYDSDGTGNALNGIIGDYTLYKGEAVQSIDTGQYAISNNTEVDLVPQLAEAFPGVDVSTTVPVQGQPAIVTRDGSAGMQWMTLTAAVDTEAIGPAGLIPAPGFASFWLTSATSGNTVEIGTIDNSNGGTVVDFAATPSIGLSMLDDYASLSLDPQYSFAVFDNLSVTAGFNPPAPSFEPLTLQVSTTNGGMQLVTGADSFEIISYEITSEGGSLNPGSFVGLDNDAARAADAIGDGDGEQWQALITTEERLVDGFLLGSSEFLAADAALLGAGYDTSGAQDLDFAYRTVSGARLAGIVSYIPSDIELPDVVVVTHPADLNGDGFVDGLDLGILLGSWDTTTTPAMGELNGTPPVDGLDLGILLGAWNPSQLSATGAVPEPSSALLLTISIALANAAARRRKLKMTRFDRGPAVLVCLAASLLTLSAHAAQLDRDYRLGDSEPTGGAGSVVGAAAGSFGATWDDAGQPNMNQFHDLNPNNGPTYVAISGRPDGGSGLGIQFDGTNYLRGRRLGDPSNSISSLGSGFGTIDYNGVTNRYLQFWVRPSSVSGASSLVQDTSQHGVGIDEGNYSLRFNAGGARAGNVDSGVAAQVDTWAHIMLVSQQQGGSPGRRLYIDGVGVAAQPGGYDLLNTADLVVGANTGGSDIGFTGGTQDFFEGIVDDLQLAVFGQGVTVDYGEFDFATDNAFAAFSLSGVDAADVNMDGVVQGDGTGPAVSDDVTAFVANYDSVNLLNFVRVGDLSTRGMGDLNFDGGVDLRDWSLLNAADPAAGAAALALIQVVGVPEPGAVALLSLGGATLTADANLGQAR